MAQVIEATAPWHMDRQFTDGTRPPAFFLAGGITGCPDWQADMIEALDDAPVTLLNPRRADFPIHDPNAAEEQITWEYRHLRLADVILFWFPAESICPIVLFELGSALATPRRQQADRLLVATHPHYPRRQDVLIQTRLARPDLEVGDSLYFLISKVREWGDQGATYQIPVSSRSEEPD